LKAQATNGKNIHHPLAKFFKGKTGPHKAKQWSGKSPEFESIVDSVKAALAEAAMRASSASTLENAAKSIESESPSQKDSMSEAQKQKMQDALKAKAQERQVKRRRLIREDSGGAAPKAKAKAKAA